MTYAGASTIPLDNDQRDGANYGHRNKLRQWQYAQRCLHRSDGAQFRHVWLYVPAGAASNATAGTRPDSGPNGGTGSSAAATSATFLVSAPHSVSPPAFRGFVGAIQPDAVGDACRHLFVGDQRHAFPGGLTLGPTNGAIGGTPTTATRLTCNGGVGGNNLHCDQQLLDHGLQRRCRHQFGTHRQPVASVTATGGSTIGG